MTFPEVETFFFRDSFRTRGLPPGPLEGVSTTTALRLGRQAGQAPRTSPALARVPMGTTTLPAAGRLVPSEAAFVYAQTRARHWLRTSGTGSTTRAVAPRLGGAAGSQSEQWGELSWRRTHSQFAG